MLSARSKGMAVALFAFLLLASSRPGYGQAITGDILGTVYDSTKAVVPSAKVTLTAVDTGIKFEAPSDDAGNYLFASLKPGRYSVQASKEGFQTSEVTNIDLLVGGRPRVDIILQVGAVSQTVEVIASGLAQLETQTSSMSQVTEETAVANLPIVGRDFIDLVALSAGVAPIGQGNSPAASWVGPSGHTTTSVAGLRETNESFIVDGIESRNARFGSANLRPSFDSIQEINVQTSDFSAEYGKSAAVINTTLRSGSNDFHGSAYDYVENDILNSNSFFNNLASLPKPISRYNDFGASIGGPVILPHYNGRDKMFFFFNYEGLRNPTVNIETALNPSPAQLAGNLADNSYGTGFFPTTSSYCTSLPGGPSSSPHCVNVINPATGQPFAGNVIPTGMLSAYDQKWLPFWPSPNVTNAPLAAPNGFPIYNYYTAARGYINANQYTARVDKVLTSRDQLWGAFTLDNRPSFVPYNEPLSGTAWPLTDRLLTITETHTFSPNVVNEGRFGYNRGRTFQVGQGANTQNYALSVFGMTNTSGNPFDFGVPGAGVSDFSDPGSPSESIGAIDTDFQWVDNLSIVHGSHNLKMGINYIHEKFYQITDFGGIPTVSFSEDYSGNSLGDFLLGDPYSATASVGDSSQNLVSNYYAGYLQDNWRVRPSLTFNIGLRYEFSQTPFDTSSKTGWFDPSTQLVEYSRTGAVRNGIVDPCWRNWGPRFGFAYSPSWLKNTVVRSAFGVFYSTDNWNELQFEVILPAYYTTQTLYSNPTTPTLSMSSLFPVGTFGSGTTVPFSLDKRSRIPYVMQWDYDVQHTFSHGMFLDVGYMGNVGQKLPQRRNSDSPTFENPATATTPIADRVPYPAYSWILLDYNGGWSSYNGLAVRFTKRLGSNMFLQAAYTYSHALDIGITDDFSASNCCFKTIDKGNGDYDVRHRFVLSYVYDLPFGKGQRYFSGATGALNKLVGGWQVSGITTFSTGQYETAYLPVDWQIMGTFSTSFPEKVGPAYTPKASRTIGDWYNINSFTYPGCPVGVFSPTTADCPNALHIQGDTARNSMEIPGINNWDLAAFKHIPITERLNTEFRAEFYNAWNHTQFAAPGLSLVPGTFGVITYLLEPPRVIQLAFKLIW